MEFRPREADAGDLAHLIRLTYPRATTGGVLLEQVTQEWDWLWDTGRFLAVAVDETLSAKTVAFMGALLIREPFYQRLCRAVHPFISRRLARAPEPGDDPLADDAETVDGSCTLLMNYFAWDVHGRTAEESAILRGYLANTFLDVHGGYAIRRIAVEVVGKQMELLATRTGSTVVNDYREWCQENKVGESERPFLVAIDRKEALQSENHWFTRAFRYRQPLLGLGLGQRQMLHWACQGLTDKQIAEKLSIGQDALKKRWETIYDRYQESLPGILPLSDGGRRGSEKRRVVVSHIRTRQEEIRP